MLDGISFDQLRTFIAAADEGSFSAAARRLKRSQSLVSQTVLNLEDRFGVKLFDRTARLPALTDQGRALLTAARAVAGQMDLLTSLAQGLSGGCETELSVVVDVMFPIAMFTTAAAALQKQFPETALKIFLEDGVTGVRHVLERRCAVGFLASSISTPPQLAREHLMTVKTAIVVSTQHPLAKYHRPIPRTTLTKYIQLVHTERSDLQPDRESGVLSSKTWHLAHIDAKLAFLRAGFGFGILPFHLVERDLAAGSLTQIGTEDSPECGEEINISTLYRTDGPPRLVGRWLIDRLVQLSRHRRLDKSAKLASSTVSPRSSLSHSPPPHHRSY